MAREGPALDLILNLQNNDLTHFIVEDFRVSGRKNMLDSIRCDQTEWVGNVKSHSETATMKQDQRDLAY